MMKGTITITQQLSVPKTGKFGKFVQNLLIIGNDGPCNGTQAGNQTGNKTGRQSSAANSSTPSSTSGQQ